MKTFTCLRIWVNVSVAARVLRVELAGVLGRHPSPPRREPAVPDQTTTTDHRRAVADAYERGWDEALDLARETLRGATDVTSALVRIEILATSRRVGPARAAEPGS